EGGVPFGKVVYRKVQTAVRSSVNQRGDPILILQHSFNQMVPGGSIRNDVGFADNSGARHPERLEDAVLQKVSIELVTNYVDEDVERGVAEVGIAPFRARRGVQA